MPSINSVGATTPDKAPSPASPPPVKVPQIFPAAVLRSVAMGLVVVILLAALWASMLLPGVYRARRQLSGIDSPRSFQRTMSMLARKCGSASPADSCPPGRRVLVLDDAASVAGFAARSRMRRRQRAALAQLGSVVFVTGVLAVVAGDRLWTMFGVSAAVFAGYALLVAQVRAREAERREKVRTIKQAGHGTPVARPGDARSNVHIRRWVG